MLFLNSCTNEDPAREAKDDLINIKQAKEYFNSTPIKIKNNIYFSNEIDWEKGHFENDTLSIPILSNKPILIKRLKNLNSSKYLYPFLLVTKNKSNNTFDYNLKVFISTNSNGYNIDSYHLYDGNNKLIQNKEKSANKNTSKTSKISVVDCELWGYFLTNNDTGERSLIYTWYVCSRSGSGSSIPEQVPPGDGSSSEPVSCGTGYIQDEYGNCVSTTQAIEDNIDDTELDPCTKDVLNKLKNLVNGDITKMLNRFSPPGSIFNINMSTGQVINPNDWAVTKPVKGSTTDINMVFNENYIKGTGNSSRPTDLSVATTMAHEVIHAYLISLLEENKACGDSGICDFPTIYDAYIQQEISKNPNILPEKHHELIAEKYVEAIAETIQNFHSGQSVITGYPYQVYVDMAWGGLTNTYIFNKNYPNDPNHVKYKDRERILDRINAERKGIEYYSAKPIGTPCKL